MRNLLRGLLKLLVYSAATVVILLAIAVGLFRLFLPRVPEYQDEIKGWASAAIGVQVEFSGMDARWGLSGPELEFYDAELLRPDDDVRIVAAEEVRVGVAFLRLLFEQSLVVDSIVIRDTSIDVQQTEDGSFRVQGLSVDEFLGADRGAREDLGDIEIIGDDVELRFMQPGDARPRAFDIRRLRVNIDGKRVAADADVRLPEDLGRQLNVSATRLAAAPASEQTWDVILEATDVSLSGWSQLVRGPRRFESGRGDLDLAFALLENRVTSASAEFDFTDVRLAGDDPFDISARVDIDASASDWLVATDELNIAWRDRAWPESSIRIEASVDADGRIAILDTRASYLDLGDLRMIEPWLAEEQQSLLRAYAPDGIVRNLVATVSEIDSDTPRFNVTAELDRVGVAEAPGRPGVRGFSGLLRANRAGGMLEIDSSNLDIAAPEILTERIAIERAKGSVIWRSSNQQTTILSDGIAVSNDFFQSQSNVQLVLNSDGSSPEIDLASSWSISDIASAKRYIPRRGLNPRLYDWFQMALVSGAITRGTTTLNGPLDRFPFDGGEGRLLMQASVRNMTFKYHQDWPATEQSDLEVTLDNARLYTTENSSVSAGIPVVNANVDIPDLRDPVLSIRSFSTGTLAAIRQFSQQSPIADVFGGQLERVMVSGEASFNLDLTVPLKRDRVQEFEFVARIRSNNGTLAIDGFNPPITDLIGEVTIQRDDISSEGLAGRFLGRDVRIVLARSEDPAYSVVATAQGDVTAEGIVSGLGVPLEGLVEGAASYEARVLFPDGKAESPSPLTIRIDSDLSGLGFDLPEPLNKAAALPLQLDGTIRFMPGGQIIESSGFAEDRVAWQLTFNRPEGFWDLDRGVVGFGGEALQAADTRGLHIRGATGVVRLEDWLSLSRSGAEKTGAADRIRSIDLVVEDLYAIGQHLQAHRVRVDRSALDWLVQIEGEDVEGSIFVPYDFGGERAMVLEMARMRLPGDDVADAPDATLDPRKLPPIQLRAEEFAFGDRNLGAVNLRLEKTDAGLEAVEIATTDDTFNINGTGRWLADGDDPLGSHSYVSATLTSTDVERTMGRLNYQPGIASDAMTMQFDLDWSGSPRAEFFDVLDGKVTVQLGAGQLEEVEPGAGRMFGLMSIVALPRRLSLDFRDVFSKGFGFDKIAGSFRIDDGITYTCDLSLEGPAADIGIVGQADLANRTYEQTAIVSANVGNTLPIVGAVVAGPQVAAALLVFSQIFKKPLQEVGQVYYGIGGSWDEPSVDSTNSAAFVASGELAGCLQDGD